MQVKNPVGLELVGDGEKPCDAKHTMTNVSGNEVSMQTHCNSVRSSSPFHLVPPLACGLGNDSPPLQLPNLEDPMFRHKRPAIKFLSWNIAGWQTKASDPAFIDYISNFDIILLQETWSLNDPVLNGYVAYSINASPSDRGGRPKGGMATFLSTKLQATVVAWDFSIRIASALTLKIATCLLVLINVYIPPQQSRAMTDDLWANLEYYIEHLIQLYPDASIIVAGDCNARIGTNDEALSARFNVTFPEPILHPNFNHREFKDCGCNYAGLRLRYMINNSGLSLLNGCIIGDRPGEFTFTSLAGASTIDYVLVSRDLMDRIHDFNVVYRAESDHLPLVLKIYFNNHKVFADLVSITPIAATTRGARIKWSEELDASMRQLLFSEPYLYFSNLITSLSSVEPVLEAYKRMVQSLQTHLTCKRLDKPATGFLHKKPWFDSECKAVKHELLVTYRTYREQNLTRIPSDWFTLKKKYKALVKRKKLQAQKETWQCLITASNLKDSASFWKIVTKGTLNHIPKQDFYILPSIWEEHFRSIYTVHSASTLTSQNDLDHIPEWPPVTIREILMLIKQLKPGKAPGTDYIPPDLIMSNADWWAPVLASLFTWIDKTACFPEDWGLAIVVPIYKRGNRGDPANYRPISLLNTISKLYARHLLGKLQDWLLDENILAEEQAGFRLGRSTIDQGLILHHLASKYSALKGGALYAAFIDFKSAFDLIPRERLWTKFEITSIDKRLLLLMRRLHENTHLRVLCNSVGILSNQVSVLNGVRQGCILAPTLFNFYINGLVGNLSNPNFHQPKLASRPISTLLYADDAVLLSTTCVGFRRLLRSFSTYCNEEQLIINYAKTKIMVVSRRRIKHKWSLNGHPVEQVACYKYLGIVFHSSGSWVTHVNHAAMNAQKNTVAITRFFHTVGGKHVPSVLQVFKARTISQMLYGSQLFAYANLRPLEIVQTKFVRDILGVPPCTSNVALRLEVGLKSIKAQAKVLMLIYWIKLIFSLEGLAPLILLDSFQSEWKKHITEEILKIGFSPSILIAMGLTDAIKAVKLRVWDIELQDHVGQLGKYNFLKKSAFITSSYLASTMSSKAIRAFTLARLNVLPSKLLEGRFRGLPASDCLCPCNSDKVETVGHVLLFCTCYRDLRMELLSSIICKSPGRSEEDYVQWLLSDSTPYITRQVAKFCAAAMVIHKQMFG